LRVLAGGMRFLPLYEQMGKIPVVYTVKKASVLSEQRSSLPVVWREHVMST